MITKYILPAFLLAGFFSGCSSPRKDSGNRHGDHAFIVYWPPPKGSGQLRLAVKDLIDMKGVVTTAGSEYLAKTGSPAARDAKCLEMARGSNVAIVGKTNLTEFALGSSGINDYFGTPKNYLYNKHRLIPGGSSGGSAVAIEDNTADVALGTDTAGSIRTPAACCGILGLKTTYGLVSLKGVFPLSPAYMDTVGPMARDIPIWCKAWICCRPGLRHDTKLPLLTSLRPKTSESGGFTSTAPIPRLTRRRMRLSLQKDFRSSN